MKTTFFSVTNLLGTAAVVVALLPSTAVHAQNAPDIGAAAPPPPPLAAGDAKPVDDSRMRPLRTLVTTMSRASGAVILADSTVANENVPLLADPTTADNFETQLDTVVKTLPTGATWAKVYLPVTGSVSRLNPDAVTNYVTAQAHLFGTVGAAAPAGTVEILGQRVPQEKATAVVAALSLKPVYILTNPRRPAAADTDKKDWNQLTPEQKQQQAQQQAQQILSMDPASQQQYFQQQRDVMRALFGSMSPEQRQQMRQNMGGGGGWGGRRGGGGGQQPQQ